MYKAALILIGTEITRGIIQDKHSQLVGKNLTSIGIHMSQIAAVPDDGTIEGILSAIVRKNDIVIITGGLGPTSDDMTRQCIADVAGSPLEVNEDSWNDLKLKLGDRLIGANEKQCYIPRGFTRIKNSNGTADGFYGRTQEGCLIISLPGPPGEMSPMFEDVVMPLLSQLSGHGEEERREYSSFIIAEAKLEDLTHQINPSLNWATRFQDYKISLYLSGGSEKEMDDAVSELRRMCGSQLIADGCTSSLELLAGLLRGQGLSLSCAESCTGGLASAMLTHLAGSSSYFCGSVVSYSNEVKENVLSVRKETIEEHGAVSVECAAEMSEGVRRLTSSDFSFSITGVAGPGESEAKKVGTVCFAFSGRGRKTQSVCLHFSSWGRESVRRKSVNAALILMKEFIECNDIASVTEGWAYI